jgi:hypothetical protein
MAKENYYIDKTATHRAGHNITYYIYTLIIYLNARGKKQNTIER